MEHAFHMEYRKGDKGFYLFPMNWKGEEELALHHDTWDEHWIFENEQFEKLLYLDLMHFSNKMFFIWNENHDIQARMPYISRLHINEPFWHISANSILFDTCLGLGELLTTIINLKINVFIFPCVYFYYNSKNWICYFSPYFQCFIFIVTMYMC